MDFLGTISFPKECKLKILELFSADNMLCWLILRACYISVLVCVDWRDRPVSQQQPVLCIFNF